MVTDRQCTATTKSGARCKGVALSDESLCFVHAPSMQARRDESRRRGGQAKSNAARAAKMWAATGREIAPDDLPAMLRAAILDVRVGTIEPSVATAIATLAKASVAITTDIDLERRIEALEQATGHQPGQLRRVS